MAAATVLLLLLLLLLLLQLHLGQPSRAASLLWHLRELLLYCGT
jgi:hypothetical protein